MVDLPSHFSRRAFLTALSVGGGSAALGVARAPQAAAAPGPRAHRARLPNQALQRNGVSVASPLVTGVNYQFLSMLDFVPAEYSAGLTYNGIAVYTETVDSYVTAALKVPNGAAVYDVEWYVSNTQPMDASVFAEAVDASAFLLLGDIQIAAQRTPAVHAVRQSFPVTKLGPYLIGTTLGFDVATRKDGSAGVTGVRVGFTQAPAASVLLPVPVRVYDSRRTGGPFSDRASRTISLAAHLPVGSMAAILNVTVAQTVGSGYLTLHAGGTSAPGTSTINWFASGQSLANQVMCAVDGSRAVTVTDSSASTQVLLDLIGFTT